MPDEAPSTEELAFSGDKSVAAWLLRPIVTANVFEETVARLAQAIKLGVVAPGSRFPSERELAEGLQVSRTTLREALRTLEHVGYVKTRRGRSGGTFVVDSLPRGSGSSSDMKELAQAMGDDLRDALDLRWALEPAAAALAARRRTEDDILDLKAKLAHSQQVPPDGFRFADLAFHLAIANMSKSESVARAVGDVQMRLGELLTALPVLKASIKHSHDQHAQVLNAIIARDESAARDTMEQHLAGTGELFRGLAE